MKGARSHVNLILLCWSNVLADGLFRVIFACAQDLDITCKTSGTASILAISTLLKGNQFAWVTISAFRVLERRFRVLERRFRVLERRFRVLQKMFFPKKNFRKFFFFIFFDATHLAARSSLLLKRTLLGSPFVPAYAFRRRPPPL